MTKYKESALDEVLIFVHLFPGLTTDKKIEVVQYFKFVFSLEFAFLIIFVEIHIIFSEMATANPLF